MNPIKIVILSLLIFTIAACGGGSPSQDVETETEEADTTDVTSVSGNDVTFLPISILETSSDYSGFDSDDIFVTQIDYPYISKKMVSVYDSSTLEAVSGTIDDFILTEDDKVVDDLESFPMLQTIGSIPTYLHTAIVIDVSNSVKTAFNDDFSAIILETKNMIATMQASSDSVIANQRFSIWAFGASVEELTDGFTSDSTVLSTAIDSIESINDIVGISSNLNQAIVEAIGNYDGGADNSDEEFVFKDVDGENNDLVEEVTTDRIQLSSLILITSGTDTVNVFGDDQVTTAIESQSQVIFDTDEGSDSDVTINLAKPFITVLVGTSEEDEAGISDVITDNASDIINLFGSTDTLTFATAVTEYQEELISERQRESDRYVLRYASPFRQGTHTAAVTTSATGYEYTLTRDIEFSEFQDVGMPSEVYLSYTITSVEITGENDQYLQNVIDINNTNTFYPATRWTSSTYAASDYSWALDGVGLASDATTGAVTIAVADITTSSTLSLTNNAIGETREIELTADASAGILLYDNLTYFPLAGLSIASTDITYTDLNEDADLETDDTDDTVEPYEVYEVYFEDYNVPLESYEYSLDSTTTWVSYDDDDTTFDYTISGSTLQIEKASIEALTGSITITINNDTLGTSASFTITI